MEVTRFGEERRAMRRGWVIAGVAALGLGPLSASAFAQKPNDGVAFFESKVRPVLVEHCASCHSEEAAAAKKLKGGLRLDHREGLLQGGDSGPALVPGEPEESLLLEVMRYDSVVRMPPKGKLPDSVLADFATWIKMGAPDPRAAGTRATRPQNVGKDHWAYRRPVAHAAPTVADTAWPRDPLDAFILARLEREGLRPAPEADRATLLRRLSFDLLGLPPTPEDLAAFTADGSDLAYEKLVDRFLASPQFGERMARHWLDVARFGESLTLRGFVLADAWRYRDYVIETFNADRPFPQFVREQTAGDLLPARDLDDQRRQLVATTYLALGNTNLEEQDKQQLRMDVVDEQLDAIGRGFLAQTIACARCHDHKFDPIPTRDYYALAGTLRNTKTLEHANVSKWVERPLPEPPERETRIAEHEKAVAALEGALKKARALASATGLAQGPIAAASLSGLVVDDTQAKAVGAWKVSQVNKTYIGDGYVHDEDEGKGEKTITFQPDVTTAGRYEVRLAYSPGANRAEKVVVTVFSADGEFDVTVNMRSAPPINGRFVSLGKYAFEANGQGYVQITNEGSKGHVTADAVQFLLEDAEADARPTPLQKTATSDDVMRLEGEIKKLKASGPKRPMVVSVVEEKSIEDAPIHVRGTVHNLGEVVPRGYLSVLAMPAPTMPADQSGRAQLADWLASAENPLTARVFVNRCWSWLFGAGLARTPDNFGTTGEPPTHPELLDRLAVDFLADGSSLKGLVRRIALSSAYRQSSLPDPKTIATDPENRLWGRAGRRRLEAECLRDAVLSASGALRTDMGGPTFPPGLSSDYGYQHTDTRRSVYAPAFRNALPPLFEVFDFADPSLVTGQRNQSTVASQALALMNNRFVIEHARLAARRLLDEALADDAARVDLAYARVLGRPPTPRERGVALTFLASSPDRAGAWSSLFQSLFGSVDFRYVD